MDFDTTVIEGSPFIAITNPLARWSAKSGLPLTVALNRRWLTFGNDYDSGELDSFLRLLDGRTDTAEIAKTLGEDEATVVTLVQELINLGVAIKLDRSIDARTARSIALVAQRQGISFNETLTRLTGLKIAILGTGSIASEIRRILALYPVDAIEILSMTDLPSSECFPIVTPSYLELTALAEINETFLLQKRPWMQVLPNDGHATAIGPIFIPHQTSCFECYSRRRLANSSGNDPLFSSQTLTADFMEDAMCAGIALMIALDWLLSMNISIPGRVSYLTYGHRGPEITSTIVRKVPRCSKCSFVDVLPPVSEWSVP